MILAFSALDGWIRTAGTQWRLNCFRNIMVCLKKIRKSPHLFYNCVYLQKRNPDIELAFQGSAFDL
jgi:hypothetical protein